MPQGTVTKLVSDRGFGFISAEEQEIFFHHSVVADGGFDNLSVGQTVEYQVEEGGADRRGKGPRASSVKPV
ncbi:MAG: cold shock domain-containing protein [Thermoguttaceae bacterium]|jgi:CspA family cold shock protein